MLLTDSTKASLLFQEITAGFLYSMCLLGIITPANKIIRVRKVQSQ